MQYKLAVQKLWATQQNYYDHLKIDNDHMYCTIIISTSKPIENLIIFLYSIEMAIC